MKPRTRTKHIQRWKTKTDEIIGFKHDSNQLIHEITRKLKLTSNATTTILKPFIRKTKPSINYLEHATNPNVHSSSSCHLRTKNWSWIWLVNEIKSTNLINCQTFDLRHPNREKARSTDIIPSQTHKAPRVMAERHNRTITTIAPSSLFRIHITTQPLDKIPSTMTKTFVRSTVINDLSWHYVLTSSS